MYTQCSYFIHRFYKLKYGLAIFALLLCTGMCAQQTDTITSDGLFTAARHAAFEQKDYNKAKEYCLKALSLSPDYADIQIFLGRMYTWTNSYDSAAACFKKVLSARPAYEDASSALADMYYWTDQYNEALQTLNSALQYNAASQELLLKKAKVLAAMHAYRQADSIVHILLAKNRGNTAALSLASSIQNSVSLNKIGIAYDLVTFDKKFNSTTPWHLASLSFTRQTMKGSVTGRINYANRFNENGIQYEADAYPRISKTFYSYVSAGYSDNVGVFPRWRAGFSLYANLPASFEAEAGWRYLYFSAPTNILTAYIGKYYKSYLFGARTYLTPGRSGLSQSYNAFGRYYFGSTDDYIELLLGSGISPDDRSINQLITANLKTYKASAEYKHRLGVLNILSVNASVLNQEQSNGAKGNQVQVGIGYQRRFK